MVAGPASSDHSEIRLGSGCGTNLEQRRNKSENGQKTYKQAHNTLGEYVIMFILCCYTLSHIILYILISVHLGAKVCTPLHQNEPSNAFSFTVIIMSTTY